MPEISRFLGIVIAMYYDEHNPPNFHVRYNDLKASISIKELSIISGKLPPKVVKLVTKWASMHQDELMNNWNLAQKYAKLNGIKPLE